MSAIACSIRGDVKNILLPPPEARLWFAASSPLSDRSDAQSCVLPCGLGFALLHLSSCMFISSDNADRFLKLASTRGCTGSTMVLSATRGLVLFRVIREGIGLTQRLMPGALCAYRRLGCSPSNPSVSRTNWPPPEKDYRRWRALPVRRSSGLRFQFVSVEVFSLLP